MVPSRLRSSSLRLSTCAAVTMLLLATPGCRKSPPDPPQPSAIPRVHGPGECLSCHRRQSEHYLDTGHAQTLSLAKGETFHARFAPQTVQLDFDTGQQMIELIHRDGQVFVASPQFPEGLPIEWVFGSGRHAQTPVTTHVNPTSRETESIQFFTTWYRDHGIARTPGLGRLLGREGITTIGSPTDLAGTMRCFRCHVSDGRLEQGVLQMDHVVPGVLCSQCHDNLELHVADSDSLPGSGGRLSPRDAVTACGECHRTGHELIANIPGAEQGNTARFAPIGILRSRCFLEQSPDQRFDCVTCHDPHLPMPSDPAFYNAKCSQCHASEELPTACLESEQTKSCVGCHMPPVNVEGVLSFTEHWIRRPELQPSTDQ